MNISFENHREQVYASAKIGSRSENKSPEREESRAQDKTTSKLFNQTHLAAVSIDQMTVPLPTSTNVAKYAIAPSGISHVAPDLFSLKQEKLLKYIVQKLQEGTHDTLNINAISEALYQIDFGKIDLPSFCIFVYLLWKNNNIKCIHHVISTFKIISQILEDKKFTSLLDKVNTGLHLKDLVFSYRFSEKSIFIKRPEEWERRWNYLESYLDKNALEISDKYYGDESSDLELLFESAIRDTRKSSLPIKLIKKYPTFISNHLVSSFQLGLFNNQHEIVAIVLDEIFKSRQSEPCLLNSCIRKSMPKETFELLVNYRNDKKGDSLLHFAAAKCYTVDDAKLLKKLLWIGSDINALNREGSTPLHIACSMHNILAIKFLISNGANLDILNDEGKNPFELISNTSFLEKISSIPGVKLKKEA